MNKLRCGCLLISLSLLTISSAIAQDVAAVKSNSSFEEVCRIDHVQQIKVSETPVTTYTPKDVRAQYNLQFTGRNDSTGAMTVWSTPIVDYNTKIIESGVNDAGMYYIKDNTNKTFTTGKDYGDDINAINNDITDLQGDVAYNRTEIKRIDGSVRASIQKMSEFQGDITNLNNSVNHINGRIDDLRHDMKAGLATVTALTSLHPNPRATEKLELSIGTGIYSDRCAGAIGLFYHPSDRVQIMAGGSYGGDSQFAGAVGITISIGGKKRRN